MKRIIGIDASFTGFTVCEMRWEEGEPPPFPLFFGWATKPTQTLRARVKRIKYLVDNTEKVIKEGIAPLVILIEGYAFSGKGNSGISLGELGGVLRSRLSGLGESLVETPPTTLKKFVTGKGNANKAEVVSALSKKYQIEFRSDDEADAFGLALMGSAAAGLITTLTKVERESTDIVKALIQKET